MAGLVFAWGYGALLTLLTFEADTPALRVAGFIASVWMFFAGAYSGWRAARAD